MGGKRTLTGTVLAATISSVMGGFGLHFSPKDTLAVHCQRELTYMEFRELMEHASLSGSTAFPNHIQTPEWG